MRLLLDTNALLWAANGELDKASVSLLDNSDNSSFYSTASIWEIVIKQSLGRQDFEVDVYRLIERLAEVDIKRLDIKEAHILGVGLLKAIHNDPFDRLIVSQAAFERLTLIGSDKLLPQYGISCHLAKRTLSAPS